MSGIRKSIAESIISELSKPAYQEDLRFIIILINRYMDLKLICKEKVRNKLVRRINSNVKVSSYFLKDLIKKFIYTLNLHHSIKTIDTTQLVIFFSHYLTIYIVNRIC